MSPEIPRRDGMREAGWHHAAHQVRHRFALRGERKVAQRNSNGPAADIHTVGLPLIAPERRSRDLLERTFSLLCLCGLLLSGCRKPGPALALLDNSGFEQPLDSGWVQVVMNDSGTRGFIERSDTLGQPDSGFAIRVYKFHKQHCSLSQTIPLETLGQVCRFTARFRLGGSVPCSPVAAVGLDYLDETGSRLGRTLFYLPSKYNTWTDNDTLHLIRISDTTGLWTKYQLNIEQELSDALPSVDRADVERLRVELLASVDYSG